MATSYATPVRQTGFAAAFIEGGAAAGGGFSTPTGGASSAVRSEPGTPFSPFTTSQDPFDAEAERQRVEQEARRFTEAKSTLVGAIETASSLLDDLKRFSHHTWTLHYPSPPSPQLSSSASDHDSASAPDPLSPFPRANATPEPPASPSAPRSLRSARTPLTASSSTSGYVSASDGMTVLSVDSFTGGKGRMLATAASGLAASLGRETLANLLLSHAGSVKAHLGDLRERLQDGSSRILITGDLNAGKSTFVNALLGRQVAPVDQQPCTEIMCEISDASINGGVEEIHAVKRGVGYDRGQAETFVRFPVDKLSELVTISTDGSDEESDEAQSPYDILKVYVEGRAPAVQETDAVSLLRNGDISVSFIDAPGLNRDTVSTTALFAKQSTIDVVIFVVSAENQFTLSAQQFLEAASHEKAYVFVVVNKWDGISNKARAERRVRDQIKRLSPRTWEGRKELIHFVDSRSTAQSAPGEVQLEDAFHHLERSLSSFVLSKRFISKLQPAQTYVRNLVHDLSLIADVNLAAAAQQEVEAAERLAAIGPECRRLSAAKATLEQGIDAVEEQTVDGVKRAAHGSLAAALDAMATATTSPVAYPGLGGIWQYAVDVKRALADALERDVRLAEDDARQRTVVGVGRIRDELGRQALPADDAGHAERVFKPEVMFARRRKATTTTTTTPSTPVASSVGLGLAAVAPADEVHLMDLFDVERFTDLARRLVKPVGGGVDDGALSLVGGVGVGSLALLSTGVAGGRAVVDSVVRICEVLGSKAARRWAGTVFAIMTLGLGVYLVVDLPRAVPRNIGRRLRRQLDSSSRLSPSAATTTTTWAEAESERIGKETRKVLRLAGWDVRERFRAALDDAKGQEAEAVGRRAAAVEAVGWLEGFAKRIGDVGGEVEGVVEWQ